MTMTASIFAVIVLTVLSAAGFFILALRAARLQRQFHELQTALATALERVETLENRAPMSTGESRQVFTARLDEARLKSRLEASGGQTPEKYRYVASMAARGMSPSEIAEVLKISPREAEQLVSLARVARNGGRADSH